MLIDQSLILSDKQEVKTETVSDNVIDQGAAGDATRGAWLHARVDEEFAGATAYKITLETSDDAEFAQKKALVEWTLTPSDMSAGARLLTLLLPVGCKRYLRMAYGVTGTGTTGKITAFITDNAANAS